MLAREVVPLPQHIYPADPWRIVESRFTSRHEGRAETIFSLSNGFLGIRGTFEEGRPSLSPATLVNAFHETWPIEYAEEAYGLARTGQTIVNVPDATVIALYVDDEPLFLPVARIREYERVLDMRTGVLVRELLWSTPAGKHVCIRSRRMVSLEHRHLAVMTYEVTVLNHSAPITLVSKVVNRQDAIPEDEVPGRPSDPRLARSFSHRVLNGDLVEAEDGRILLGYRTTNSRMTLGMGVEHVVETETDADIQVTADQDLSRFVLTAHAQPGVPIRLAKYVTYQRSRSQPPRELVDRCRRTLHRAVGDGVDALLAAQRENLDRFWDRADVRVSASDEPERTQQAVRWNLFQLAQATWRAEGEGVSAKGLTGQAYDGHYFWDTEIFVLPFLAYTRPRIARNLLRFRYSMLDQARQRARKLSQRGALYPWRTINGEEASAYYQAGTAQYHIDADIAYAIRKYVDVRDDPGFLVEVGAEILVETARLWEDLGFYGDDGEFHIHGVTGPDEYTTVVNDNTFTNLMARLNLNYAASAVRRLEAERPADYRALVQDVGLEPGEVESWERAAAAMHVPYDEERGVHPQDDGFLDREPWDLEQTPRSHFPLLLHYHPLVIYRHQVLKQADVVQAMFLLGNEFTLEQKRRNFYYYDPRTTGDSSLSAGIQSIMAAEIGDEEKALEYFTYANLMDLGDVAGNVSDGVHVACTGAVWQALVFGFGGVRDFDGHLRIDPRLPRAWEALEFSLRFQDRQLRISLRHDTERFLLEEGKPLKVRIRGQECELRADEPRTSTLPPSSGPRAEGREEPASPGRPSS
jgi:alpha,alpha-trehalose phosphorylase